MSIQTAKQNNAALAGHASINIPSSPIQTGSLGVLNNAFERQRHVDVIETLREKKLPFLENLMSQIDTIKRVYRETNDFQEMRTLESSLEKIQSAKYKNKGYVSRLFSHETWDEWTEDKTALGKIINLLEDHVQNGLPLKYFDRHLKASTVTQGELEAKAVVKSLSKAAPRSLLRTLGSRRLDNTPVLQPTWVLKNAQLNPLYPNSYFSISGRPGLLSDTSAFPPPNIFASEQKYTLQCTAYQGTGALVLDVSSGFFPPISVSTGVNSQNDYIFSFQIPKGFNGPANLTLSLGASGGARIYVSPIFITPSLSFKPEPPIIETPVPNQKASIGQPFVYSLPSNLFFDPQEKPLTLAATLTNGAPLPSWLLFDVSQQPISFYGTPSIASSGFSISLTATNTYDQSTAMNFIMVVQHILPLLNVPIPDQQATIGQRFTYSLSLATFYDPVGNPLTYSAKQSSGAPLPSWLSFKTQTFIGTPASGNEGSLSILVAANDGFEGSVEAAFTLSVQKASISSSTIAEGVSIGAPILLFSAIIGTLFYCKKRIRSTQEQIMAIDSKGSSTATITAVEIEEEFLKLQKEAHYITLYTADHFQAHFLEFLEQINAFCLERPADSIFDLVDIHGLLNNLLIKMHDKTTRKSSIWAVELILSQTIHQLCDLIILTETAAGRSINETHKREFLQNLSETISRIPENNTDIIISDIRFHLESSSEAVRCMIDTNSLSRLLKTSVYHILSPGKLAGDIGAIFSNGPSEWYPTLLTMRSMIPLAMNSLETVQKLQKLILTQSDWHFLYESIEILGALAKNGTTEEIRSQALNGTADEPGLVKFLGWAPYLIKKDRNTWLQNKAKDASAALATHFRRKNSVQSAQDQTRATSITPDKLKEDLSTLQKEANFITLYNVNNFQNHFLNTLQQMNAFCLEHPEGSLFDLISMHGLLKNLLIKIHDKTLRGTSSRAVTLPLSQMIHQLCDLTILIETTSGKRIDEKHKIEFFQKLEETLDRIPENNADIKNPEIRFHLESSLEAIRCMIDTNNLLGLAKQNISDILSRAALASDLKATFGKKTDQWYPLLVALRSIVPLAKNSLETLKKLQEIIATQSNWCFYYESIAILSDIAKNGATEEIRSQALNGSAAEPGLVSFLQGGPSQIKKDRNLWLQNKTKEESALISK